MKSKNLKHQRLNTKSNYGITLVALIITIVVLLILAIVAIGTVKNSDIIGHAQNAGDSYAVGQEKEQIGVALGQWQIERGIAGSTKTFKGVITNALQGQNVSITGDDNGPLTVTFNKTGNAYQVTKEGVITEAQPGNSGGQEGEKGENIILLEQYLFGDDPNGKNYLKELSSDGVNYNKNDELGIAEGDVKRLDLVLADNKYIFYIEYEGAKYKFKTGFDGDMPTNTIPSYGVVRIDDWDVESRVGKYVEDENRDIWRIIYDDDTHGLQMISVNTYQYNNSEFYLGSTDTLIGDRATLNTEIEEFKLADLNGNKTLDDDLEQTIYSYNQAIENLNIACENLFKDANGNYTRTNIQDVRSVGSNPVFANKNSENKTPYTSEDGKYLKIWPKNNENEAAGLYDGKIYSTDDNFETDFDRMIALGINKSDNIYWLASRWSYAIPGNVYFDMYWINDGVLGSSSLFGVTESNAYTNYGNYALRPVISLNPSIQFSGSGTAEDPYTF